MANIKKFYVPFLSLATVMLLAAVLGFSVWTASQGYSQRLQCFERLLSARKQPTLYVWNLSKAEERAELEVIAWEIVRTLKSPYCAQTTTEVVTREVRSFEWRRFFDYKKVHDPLVREVARHGLMRQYQHFQPHKYTCAETYYYKLDPRPLAPGFQLVPVGEPVGRVQLYGKKECVERNKKYGRAKGSPVVFVDK